jgi:hypothetical protein
MQGMVWDDLRYVLALYRFQSIAEAARRLTVDEATVGSNTWRRAGCAVKTCFQSASSP